MPSSYQLPGLERILRPEERGAEPSPLVESLDTKSPSKHTQRGEFLRRMDQLDEALVELEKALDDNSNDAYALATKGRILRARGQLEDAVRLLQDAISIDPQLDWALTDLTDWLCELGRENDAEELVARLLNSGEEDAPTQGVYGRLLRQMGKLEPGSAALRNAIALQPDLAWLHAQLGEVFRLQNKFGEALDAFTEAQKLAEKKSLGTEIVAWILTRKGWVLTNTRRFGDALQTLARALELSPQYALAGQLMAQALWEGGQREKCFQHLKEVIVASTEPTWAYLELASYAQDMGLYEEALEVIDECLLENPDFVPLLIRKGELFHRTGDFAASVEILDKAQALDPTNWRALELKGSALRYLGKDHHQRALTAIEDALKLSDGEPTLLAVKGDILRAQGDTEAAARDYRRAIERLDVQKRERPQSIDAPTMWLMGWCRLWLNDDELAFRLLAHAKSLKPNLYVVRFFLALALLIRGHVVQADREYTAAIETIRDKSPLLRRGILRSSLYALRVALERHQVSPEHATGWSAMNQQPTSPETTAAGIKRELEKELERANEEFASIVPKRSTLIPESRPKQRDIAAQGVDRDAESDSAPHLNLLVRPTADPMVPMIRLDHEFNVLDWNIAASLAFDGTLGRQRGEYVGNWIVQNFDNPLAIVEHGEIAFGDPERQPAIDVEEQHFSSQIYGGFDMTKRAYRIPADDGSCFGWLVTFETRFSDPEHLLQFRKDLIREVSKDNVWSEHALSYDAVLSISSVYEELLSTMIGEIGPLERIADGTRVLDLGAGTGNLTLKLATTFERLFIVAVDNNCAMLDTLLSKCRSHLRNKDRSDGVVAIRQDITKLSCAFGEKEEKFDFAFLVNSLNTASDPKEVLKGVFGLLKPGGEVRITGPRPDSKIDVLFESIKRDLEDKGQFERVKPYFEHLLELNSHQLAQTFRWDVSDIEKLLLDVGFSKIIERGESVCAYAGQSMLLAARK